jgi:hypothetical protein
MKSHPEADVLSSCLAYLRLKGVLCWRSNNAGVYDPGRKRFRSFRGLKGVADILGILDGGRLLAVETKSATGRLSADQRWFLDEVTRRGGLALVVRDVRELAAALDRLATDDPVSQTEILAQRNRRGFTPPP